MKNPAKIALMAIIALTSAVSNATGEIHIENPPKVEVNECTPSKMDEDTGAALTGFNAFLHDCSRVGDVTSVTFSGIDELEVRTDSNSDDLFAHNTSSKIQIAFDNFKQANAYKNLIEQGKIVSIDLLKSSDITDPFDISDTDKLFRTSVHDMVNMVPPRK